VYTPGRAFEPVRGHGHRVYVVGDQRFFEAQEIDRNSLAGRMKQGDNAGLVAVVSGRRRASRGERSCRRRGSVESDRPSRSR
jgi:hypothetical protein